MMSFIKYPGGKTRMVKDILPLLPKNNEFTDVFVGGGSIALAYAAKYKEAQMYLNDLDPFTYALWNVTANGTNKEIERLLEFVAITPTIKLFNEYRERIDTTDRVERAYFCIVFHQCTFSGMFNGGPIGGQAQKSKWKIDCRYNSKAIAGKIVEIRSLLHGRTTVTNQDFRDLEMKGTVYLDPPYVEVGNKIYDMAFKEQDHKDLAAKVLALNTPWLLSYNDVPVVRNLYEDCNIEVLGRKAAMTSFCKGGCKTKSELLIRRKELNDE